MLHRVRGDRVERTADFAVARQLEASDGVDYDPARVGRILHRHSQFELDRNSGKALTLDTQEADFVVVLPWYVIGGTDMYVDIGHPLRQHALHRLGLRL